jgi:hypothetical protein
MASLQPEPRSWRSKREDMPPFLQPGGHLDAAFHRGGFEHLIVGESETLEGDLAHRDL